ALAGDDLVAPRGARPHDQRLDDPLVPDRLGETGARLAVEAPARLLRVRVNGIDRQVEQLRGARLEPTDQHLEAAAEAAPLTRRARQAPSPPSSTRRHRATGGRTRSRGDRGSAPRRGAPSAAPSA